MQVTRLGLDIAKSVFQVHGVDEHGKVVVRKQLSRSKVLAYFAQVPACRIGIEACGSAHYWGRELQKLGHDGATGGTLRFDAIARMFFLQFSPEQGVSASSRSAKFPQMTRTGNFPTLKRSGKQPER